jgi:hypothetical protein
VPIHAPEAINWCLRQLAERPGLWESQWAATLTLAIKVLDWESYGERAIAQYRSQLALSGSGMKE